MSVFIYFLGGWGGGEQDQNWFPPHSFQADPKNVMLVHGEAAKMEFLKQKVMQEFGINCFMPANGEMVTIQTPPIIPADISRLLLKRTLQQCYGM